jgi:hypothetical protein
MRKCTAFLAAGLLLFPALASAESPITFLPVGKSWADGRKLPLPVGLTLTYYNQQQDYDLDKITLPELKIPVSSTGIEVVNRLTEVNLQLDAWLLPWLDVFGILGKLDAKTSVDGVALGGQQIAVPDYKYDGIVYGGGMTLAGGLGNWFGALTGIYTNTNLSGDGSSVSSWVVTPKVGYDFGQFRLWGGGMFQRAEEKHTGTFTMMMPTDLTNPNPTEFAPRTVSYEVQLHEKEPWNFLIGAETGFNEHWRLSGEWGIGGPRTQVQLSLTCRI